MGLGLGVLADVLAREDRLEPIRPQDGLGREVTHLVRVRVSVSVSVRVRARVRVSVRARVRVRVKG